MCRTSYWVSPDETGLLVLRLGAKFRPARPVELLAALLAPRPEVLLKRLIFWNGGSIFFKRSFFYEKTTVFKYCGLFYCEAKFFYVLQHHNDVFYLRA